MKALRRYCSSASPSHSQSQTNTVYSSVEPEATAPQESVASVSGLTVVALHDEPGLGEGFEEMPAPVVPMDVEDEQSINTPAPAPKKRGRPSRSASGTPAGSTISKAGRPTKSTHSNKAVGRKRKAPMPQKEDEAATEESEIERQLSPAKRGRPTRTTAAVASARLAAGATKKLTRGRPKNGTTVSNKTCRVHIQYLTSGADCKYWSAKEKYQQRCHAYRRI